MNVVDIIIEHGLRPQDRAPAAALFWDAFSGKLSPVMGPHFRALPFLIQVLDPTHAISARDAAGQLLGIAGFKTARGSFVGGDWADLAQHYGTFGAVWRAVPLSVLERAVQPDMLLMDGICVDEAARGRGVGTQLLTAVKAEARQRGLTAVRLDVIDSNPRAKALYQRQGFVPAGTVTLGPLRHVFGFREATTMTCAV
ncbi:GNAT family N-acetyltransferase [Actibacterium sp. 188UL27-1]|nr:GNAT family N-acetyltransferase [Actibacterium sp. 188UL27-1]MBM7066525.1 GNAT family N-acetyltransferase [Actibacterium sp. 188UL27-1]